TMPGRNRISASERCWGRFFLVNGLSAPEGRQPGAAAPPGLKRPCLLRGHALLVEFLELGTGVVLGGLLQLLQERLLILVDLAVGEQHFAQPAGLRLVDLA